MVVTHIKKLIHSKVDADINIVMLYEKVKR